MSGYWEIRENILKALSAYDDAKLKQLAARHPGVFQNVVNQAKNSTQKKKKK